MKEYYSEKSLNLDVDCYLNDKNQIDKEVELCGGSTKL